MEHQDHLVAVSGKCSSQSRRQDDATVESEVGHSIGSSSFDFTMRRCFDGPGKDLGSISAGVQCKCQNRAIECIPKKGIQERRGPYSVQSIDPGIQEQKLDVQWRTTNNVGIERHWNGQ